MSEDKVNVYVGTPHPKLSDVLDDWRHRLRRLLDEPSWGPGGPEVNERVLAIYREDLARDLAAAGSPGAASIRAEVLDRVGAPLKIRYSLDVEPGAEMADHARRSFGHLVNESVTQRSLDHLLLDPVAVVIPRGTLDKLLEVESQAEAMRLDLLAALSLLDLLATAPTDEDRARARALVADLGERWGLPEVPAARPT